MLELLHTEQLNQLVLGIVLMIYSGLGLFHLYEMQRNNIFLGKYLIPLAVLLVELQLLLIISKIFSGNVLTLTPLN